MKNKFLTLLIVICSLMFVFGCTDPIEFTDINNGNTDGALVSIYIGEPSARTILPSIEGYQLTFTGGTYEPVNITDGASKANVYLDNGTWTITAKAYKLGGTIGNNADVVASGSISVTISGGAVSGTVQPIILTPVGTGNGTLHYDITFGSGVTGSGSLTLWQIDGDTKVTAFPTNGVLSLSSSVNDNFELSAGRYIVEAKLTATDSKIAFRREVVEIWQGTTSVFEFAPAVYLDPNAILPNSRAVLSETNSKFNNVAIGSGKGSGTSEADPKTYTFTLSTPASVTITLEAETNSLFSTISWAANTGALPNGVYSNGTLPTNLSTNNVLWVKVVSEDGSTAMYYRFVNMVSVTYGNSNYFTVLTSNPSGISWSNPNLNITQSGIYYITGTGTETTNNRIQVTGSNITADITLKNVNINVSNSSGAVAFNPNVNNGQGVTINLTLEGSNTFRSGANVPGLNISSGTIMNITDASTGTLTVYGRDGNVGTNGSSSDAWAGSGGSGLNGINIDGTMIINGGTITATGGNGGTGGRGYTSSSGIGYAGGSGGMGINVSGIFTINGGTVTANGGNGGNGGEVYSNASFRQSDTMYDYQANGGRGGTGISVSNITINGGTVTAKGGNGGNGGMGNNQTRGFPANGGNGGSGISSIFAISGTYTATGGSGGTAWSAANNTAKGTNGSAGANVSAGNSNNISATLTANKWQNGNITTAGGDEWFMFTATASTQFIHVNVGTLTSLYVQVYDSNRTAVGSQTSLNSSTKYTSRSLTVGQEYYIRVTPYSSSYSGTYQIAFNAGVFTPDGTPTATTLTTANTWEDGNITTAGGVQWFKFTATASTQYIHVSFGTLTDLYVQVYDSNGGTVGSQTNLYSSTKNISRPLTVGQEYYIRVWPYSSSGSGTYQIAFNAGVFTPGTTATTLTTANTWENGNITTAGGEQWFKFTATASTQYIHVSFGTLTDLYVQVYDSNGGTVGSQTNLYSSTKNISRPLTVGQEYYIRVWPYSSSGSGTYQIAFNASETAPQ